MIEKTLIHSDVVSDNLLSSLERREVALWIHSLPNDPEIQEAFAAFLGLPWKMVLIERCEPALLEALERKASFADPMTRKRGFVEVIDGDPSRIELPQRCLPVFLLNGRSNDQSSVDFASQLRRMTMLEELRRSSVREILVLPGDEKPAIPQGLRDLWSNGFRSYLTYVSDSADTRNLLQDWINSLAGVGAVNLLRLSTRQAALEVLARYSTTYPEDRQVIRVRDARGVLRKIDITEADEPERPILERYSIIEDRDLTPLMPEELNEADLVEFFRGSSPSWRPYAAGLPWVADADGKKKLQSCLRKLDANGPEDTCIAYISSEPGAGGTTLARYLAWECAQEGYPVLLAKPIAFLPEALPVVNYLNHAHSRIEDQGRFGANSPGGLSVKTEGQASDSSPRRHETPWIIVYDSLHWQDRDSELVRFRNELAKSGRPVCLLVVTGTALGLSFYNTSIFKQIATLNHALDQEDARQLGRHLNRFLRVYGHERKEWQWDRFYQEHTVRYLEGTAAFWVTLSFWIQGQYDLSESIQEWVYRLFKKAADSRILQDAILEIAALSSERLPLPEVLLPTEKGQWPVSHLLEDRRASLAALGLTRISTDGEKHWALVHDILGRFLINALFYDFPLRKKLGLADAKDAEHLRFLLLRQVSRKSELGERHFRPIGEEFATSIFKIDPDHGRGNFVLYWREVLDALDHMPHSLRDTSRVFRHHTAVSRRRIAKLDKNYFGVTNEDKISLLEEAIADIEYALYFIEYTPGSEPNLNLYNSLANAYLDLSEAESERGASRERITDLRKKANEATRKVYEESPTNSFVIETYVKNLLENARESENPIELCLEAIGILFSALTSNVATYRRPQLGTLAENALELLFQQAPKNIFDIEPRNAAEVLVKAWTVLAPKDGFQSGIALSDVSEEKRELALKILSSPAGRGNMQVIRLSYDLVSTTHPFAFNRQLELVEELQATDYRISPQLQLEYAILLFQNSRAVEGDKMFRLLRRLWRDGEHFVHVPERLRWLWAQNSKSFQSVRGIVGSDYGNRAMARVREFGNVLVPFRPEEFGFRDPRPGLPIACHVSFGHNGPLLRPLTVSSPKAE